MHDCQPANLVARGRPARRRPRAAAAPRASQPPPHHAPRARGRARGAAAALPLRKLAVAMMHQAFFTLLHLGAASAALQFQPKLFSSGMILQRGAGTKVFGIGAASGSTVHVALKGTPAGRGAEPTATATASAQARADGTWVVSMPATHAMTSATLSATDGSTSLDQCTLSDVNVGEVLLCGGQSNVRPRLALHY
jgi:hypothetical protein